MLRISVQLAFWLCWCLVLMPVMGKAQRLPTQPLELLRLFLVEHPNPEQIVLGQLRTVDLDCHGSDFINMHRSSLGTCIPGNIEYRSRKGDMGPT